MTCWRDIENSDLSQNDLIQLLRVHHIIKAFPMCIDCEGKVMKQSRKNMLKCQNCHTEWSIKKGSIIENSKLPLRKLLLLYFLYLDQHNAHKASKIAKVNKNTARRLFQKFKNL